MLQVLYLVFNEGYGGDVDLSAEAIRLTRQLVRLTDDEEAVGLLALMLLHHARRPARMRPDGTLVPLADQDRSRWDSDLIAEGVELLQAALGRERRGPYQVQAAIAALHADARSTAETDWVQVLAWYDELVALTDSPVVRLNRAVAVGEADGAQAGLAALRDLDPDLPRHRAVSAHLHEKAGDLEVAARLYAEAAALATNVAERTHLSRQAARLRRPDGPPATTLMAARLVEMPREHAPARDPHPLRDDQVGRPDSTGSSQGSTSGPTSTASGSGSRRARTTTVPATSSTPRSTR